MPQLLRLRELTAEEERVIGRLAHSRTAPARVVERARIVDLAAHGWCATGHAILVTGSADLAWLPLMSGVSSVIPAPTRTAVAALVLSSSQYYKAIHKSQYRG